MSSIACSPSRTRRGRAKFERNGCALLDFQRSSSDGRPARVQFALLSVERPWLRQSFERIERIIFREQRARQPDEKARHTDRWTEADGSRRAEARYAAATNVNTDVDTDGDGLTDNIEVMLGIPRIRIRTVTDSRTVSKSLSDLIHSTRPACPIYRRRATSAIPYPNSFNLQKEKRRKMWFKLFPIAAASSSAGASLVTSIGRWSITMGLSLGLAAAPVSSILQRFYWRGWRPELHDGERDGDYFRPHHDHGSPRR